MVYNRYIIPECKVAVMGGSGFYKMDHVIDEIHIETPYGKPSNVVTIADIDGHIVAFLARHGEKHEFPPHTINYRANIWALKQLGIQKVIATGAVGSLRMDWKIGDIVLCDQFVNKTWGRKDTFFDGPVTTHISVSDPYCSEMREKFLQTGQDIGIKVIENGVLLVIEGPRFSTQAENRDWLKSGYDVISMTHYPEVVLAKELGMCYTSVCMITDYANIMGLEQPSEINKGHKDVVRTYEEHKSKLLQLIKCTVPKITGRGSCMCHTALEGARVDDRLLSEGNGIDLIAPFTETRLRYGHNPHQSAQWISPRLIDMNYSASIKMLEGSSAQELSLTDIQNMDHVIRFLKYQKEDTIVIIKHAVVTGAAFGNKSVVQLFTKAYHADMRAARTGTVALKGKLTSELAKSLMHLTFDIIAATEWEEEAICILSESITLCRTNMRLFRIGHLNQLPAFVGDKCYYHEYYTFNDGSYAIEKPFLTKIKAITDFKIYEPTCSSKMNGDEFLFAWYLTIISRTNSCVIVKDCHVLSVSAGNQDGLSAVELAIFRANSRYEGDSVLQGCTVSTDGNFPFEIPFELLVQNQVGTIIIPGSAENDEIIIKTMNDAGIRVVLTGERCFNHR